MSKVFVSADISKEKINFAVLHGLEIISEHEIANKLSDIRKFIKEAYRAAIAIVDSEHVSFIMEHTGIYNNLLLKALVQAGYDSYLCSGLSVKNSTGAAKGKSDKIDAVRIGHYAFRYFDKLVKYQPHNPIVRKLKILETKRSHLVKTLQSLTQAKGDNMRFMEKEDLNMLKKFDDKVVAELKSAIKKIERYMEELVKEEEELYKKYCIAKSVPGVGKITALTLICMTNNFSNFKHAKSLASYCGVVPFKHESGKWKGRTRVSHFANKVLKKLLHLGALSLTRSKKSFGQYYRKKLAENKKEMLVLNNLRNKMIKTVFACVVSGKMYSENYQHPLAS